MNRLRGLKNKRSHFLKICVVAVFLVIMFLFLGKAGTFVEGEYVQALLKSSGIFAPLTILIIYVVTIVVAPLTGFPLVVLTIAALGPLPTAIMNILAIFLGGTINFYISKKYGRGVIRRFVGRGGLARVDNLAGQFGLEMLILTRLFQGFLFEWVSYAAGLTGISYKTYIVITVVCSLPYVLSLYGLSLLIHDTGQLYIYFTLLNYLLLTVPAIYYLGKKYLEPKTKSAEKLV